MDATTCSLCLLVGVVMMLQAIYLVLAMVGRFVCGKGKPADVARPAPAGLGPAAVVTAAVPGAASATVPAHVTHNHHEDEEEHAGATDDDSHGSMEAEAEEKEEEEEEVEEEEEEVQDGRETGKSDFRKMLKNSEENSTCCRLYGLLIDQMGEHGRENHSGLALSLPRGLSYQEFGKSFARRLREEGLDKMNSTQASPYYQLYRAFDREEGKFMPTIRRARGLSS